MHAESIFLPAGFGCVLQSRAEHIESRLQWKCKINYTSGGDRRELGSFGKVTFGYPTVVSNGHMQEGVWSPRPGIFRVDLSTNHVNAGRISARGRQRSGVAPVT